MLLKYIHICMKHMIIDNIDVGVDSVYKKLSCTLWLNTAGRLDESCHEYIREFSRVSAKSVGWDIL